MAKTLLICAIFLFTSPAFGQDLRQLAIDTCDSRNDTDRMYAYVDLGNYYLSRPGSERADMDSTWLYFYKALQISDKIKDKKYKAYTMVYLGIYYGQSNKLEQCREALHYAQAFYLQNQLYHEAANAWQWMGDILSDYTKSNSRYADECIASYKAAVPLFAKGQDMSSVFTMYEKIAAQYELLADIDSLRFYNILELKYYQQKGDLQRQAEIIRRMGKNTENLGVRGDRLSLEDFSNAASIYHQLKDEKQEIDMHHELASIHTRLGQYDTAEKELLVVLQYYQRSNSNQVSYIFNELAENWAGAGEQYKDLYYKLKMLDELNKPGADTSRLFICYHHLVRAYAGLGMYDKSLFWARKAIASERAIKETETFVTDLIWCMNDLVQAGRTKEGTDLFIDNINTVSVATLLQRARTQRGYGLYYSLLHDYGRAEKSFLQYDSLYKLYDPHFYRQDDLFYVNYTLGHFYVEWGKYAKGRPYFDFILRSATTKIEPGNKSLIYGDLFKVDSAAGDYKAAIADLEIHKKLDDSIAHAIRVQEVADLQIRYETQKKEQSIIDLQNKGQLQNAELQKVNIERNVTIGGIAALLLISGLAYNGYRNKRRGNIRLLESEMEIRRQNLSLQGLLNDKDVLLSEKDWLLKEVHHRVKNNLQIVMSLLNTQSAYLKNDAAITAIRESQNRVQTISLIHQRLYNTTNMDSIDINVYINELVSYLEESFGARGKNIRFEKLIDNIGIDLSQAVPLGLILNEAITNCIKYAFTDEGGEVIIALQRLGAETALLNIIDNGRGLSKDLDLNNTTSLGLEMMKALSKQLGGTFEIRSSGGVSVCVEFQLIKVADRSKKYIAIEN